MCWQGCGNSYIAGGNAKLIASLENGLDVS